MGGIWGERNVKSNKYIINSQRDGKTNWHTVRTRCAFLLAYMGNTHEN